MGNRKWSSRLTLLAVGIALAGSTPLRAADQPDTLWFEHFNGHAMWATNTDSAFSLAAREGKPVIVDFYQRH